MKKKICGIFAGKKTAIEINFGLMMMHARCSINTSPYGYGGVGMSIDIWCVCVFSRGPFFEGLRDIAVFFDGSG